MTIPDIPRSRRGSDVSQVTPDKGQDLRSSLDTGQGQPFAISDLNGPEMLPTRTARSSRFPLPLDLIAVAPTIPDGVLPDGASIMQRNGLVVVAKSPLSSVIPVYSEKEMPQDAVQPTEVIPKTIVPAHVWGATIEGGLARLAEETGNAAAKAIIDTNQGLQGVGQLARDRSHTSP